MDAILLCMKKRGILFFRKIKFPTTNVVRFHSKDNFLGLLRSRCNEYDNVLIMAHGANHAILTTTTDLHEPYVPYIGKKETDALENDFVFAVSCLTANEFGKCCVEKGSIAYLGYQVEIGCLFTSDPSPQSNVPDSIITAVNTLVKHIFIAELSKAYEEFLKTPISVRVLKERFAFAFEKRLAELLDMSTEQVYNKYSVKISERHYTAYAVKMILNVLAVLDDILPKLICISDENYISSSYIRFRKEAGFSSNEISEELEANPYFQKLAHDEYKRYLRGIAAG